MVTLAQSLDKCWVKYMEENSLHRLSVLWYTTLPFEPTGSTDSVLKCSFKVAEHQSNLFLNGPLSLSCLYLIFKYRHHPLSLHAFSTKMFSGKIKWGTSCILGGIFVFLLPVGQLSCRVLTIWLRLWPEKLARLIACQTHHGLIQREHPRQNIKLLWSR